MLIDLENLGDSRRQSAPVALLDRLDLARCSFCLRICGRRMSSQKMTIIARRHELHPGRRLIAADSRGG